MAWRLKIQGLFPEVVRDGGVVWDAEGMNVFIPDRDIELDMMCYPSGQYSYVLHNILQTLPYYDPAYDYIDVPCEVKDLEKGTRANCIVAVLVKRRYRIK